MERMGNTVFEVLDRLAKSQHRGNQGEGFCVSRQMWVTLVHRKYAAPVIGQPEKVLALTLRGFRALEEERVARSK